METETNHDERFLKGAAVVLTVLLAVVSLAATTQQRPRFEEISAERINIVEPNGNPRLILYNSSHTPGAILYGKDNPHPNRSPHAGMLYFNDEGTENGGHLTFDQFDQDQVVSLVGGLRVWDQPYFPMAQLLERVQAARSKPDSGTCSCECCSDSFSPRSSSPRPPSGVFSSGDSLSPRT